MPRLVVPSSPVCSAMAQDAWQLNPPLARIVTKQLGGEFDGSRPQSGLTKLNVAGRTIEGRPFQLKIPGQANRLEIPVEFYVRGMDLVCQYAQTPNRPFRTQLNWRLLTGAADAPLGGIELIVSVQTALLDSLPALVVRSELAAEESRRLEGLDQQVFQPVSLDNPSGPSQAPATPPLSCHLYRLAHDLSYLEMFPPADPVSTAISAGSDGLVQTTHRLFAWHLEKGVILRSRIRGVFLHRRDDEQTALDCFDRFIHSRLPLST